MERTRQAGMEVNTKWAGRGGGFRLSDAQQEHNNHIHARMQTRNTWAFFVRLRSTCGVAPPKNHPGPICLCLSLCLSLCSCLSVCVSVCVCVCMLPLPFFVPALYVREGIMDYINAFTARHFDPCSPLHLLWYCAAAVAAVLWLPCARVWAALSGGHLGREMFASPRTVEGAHPVTHGIAQRRASPETRCKRSGKKENERCVLRHLTGSVSTRYSSSASSFASLFSFSHLLPVALPHLPSPLCAQRHADTHHGKFEGGWCSRGGHGAQCFEGGRVFVVAVSC